MKRVASTTLAFAIAMACAAGAWAENMGQDQYKAAGKSIDAEYKSAKGGCDSLAGNAKDICVEQAKGKRNVDQAELAYNHKPSVKARYTARVARADADYVVAKEKCDDKAGNDKSVCRKEAKAIQVHAIADAKTQMKSTDANAMANEKSADANAAASEKKADARKDASADKRSADYAVAKVRCDGLAGNAKDQCLSEAKMRYTTP